jgi:hypothetical protein
MIKNDKNDKPVKKLKLDTETLRTLDTNDLADANGGFPSINSISISISAGAECPKCCACN